MDKDSAATAVLEQGLRFRVQGPDGDLVTDMAPSLGGGGSAPSPGWALRAALASCDASMVAIVANEAGVELTRLEVTVTSESDWRGVLGTDDTAPAGPLNMTTRIELAAENATDDELHAIVTCAERRSPVRDAIARVVPMTTEVVIGP